uniref:Uncharacterized protein n=1 Tax=Oryza brachyantha TaxID=4533 RepID=J3MWC3_ORYBR
MDDPNWLENLRRRLAMLMEQTNGTSSPTVMPTQPNPEEGSSKSPRAGKKTCAKKLACKKMKPT